MPRSTPEKQWWAPVWKGLVMDGQARHCRRMRHAVWLYLYFLLNANRKTGALMRKIQTISQDMGVPRDTIIRWLRLLRTNGYVSTANTGHSLSIQVTRWKPLPGVANIRHQMSDISNTRYGRFPTPDQAPGSPNPEGTRGVATAANETKIQVYLHNDMRRGPPVDSPVVGFTSLGACARPEALAQELARDLDDRAGLNLYRAYCRKYPEELLRAVLAEVRAVPATKIVKSRGALFTYLIQHHAQRTTENPGG